MPKLLVIADDLSGATDVGVQFARHGIAAVIVVPALQNPTGPSTGPVSDDDVASTPDSARWIELFHRHEVVLVDAESRHLAPAAAAARVRAFVTAARSAGVDYFYKKTDSTLRGNPGAELEALRTASGQRTLCFVPAHPTLGRVTRDGVQYAHGAPLHETAFAQDPRHPMTESRVTVLLSQQTSLPLFHVSAEGRRAFAEHPPEGIVVFDAETPADIQEIARTLRDANSLAALAGPAALASQLPEILAFERHSRPPPRWDGPRLVVNGSLNEMALRQCAHARRNGMAGELLTPDLVVPDEGPASPNALSLIERVAEQLASGRDMLLATLARREECAPFEAAAREQSLPAAELHDRIARNTGRIVAAILNRIRAAAAPPPSIVVFGGDTLTGLARAMSWTGLIPRDELLPGVALCEVAGQPDFSIASKPGGFGELTVLAQLTTRRTGSLSVVGRTVGRQVSGSVVGSAGECG